MSKYQGLGAVTTILSPPSLPNLGNLKFPFSLPTSALFLLRLIARGARHINTGAPAPGCIGREEDGTTHTTFYSITMESRRPNRRTKHYRAAEMPSPSWDQPQVAPPATPNIWVITGPSGAGKSRVGKHLCAKLGFIFVEGDEVSLHPYYYPSPLPQQQANLHSSSLLRKRQTAESSAMNAMPKSSLQPSTKP